MNYEYNVNTQSVNKTIDILIFLNDLTERCVNIKVKNLYFYYNLFLVELAIIKDQHLTFLLTTFDIGHL